MACGAIPESVSALTVKASSGFAPLKGASRPSRLSEKQYQLRSGLVKKLSIFLNQRTGFRLGAFDAHRERERSHQPNPA
jgi:hypothetical protein